MATLPSDNGQQLQLFIDGARVVIEDIVGPVIQTVYDEFYDGGNPFITLRRRPVASVTSVTIYLGPVAYPLTQIATPDQGTLWSYIYETEGRVVRRGPGGGFIDFPAGLETVQVVYTAGRTVIPANIKLACLELVRHNYQLTQQAGRPAFQGAAGEDVITPGSGFAIPNRVLDWLEAYKRHPSLA